MDDARLTLQGFLERARRSILRQGFESLAAVRLAGREHRRAVGVDDVEHRRHAHGFCLPMESFRALAAATFSMRTVNVWSAAWADTPPMASSRLASTDILFDMVGLFR